MLSLALILLVTVVACAMPASDARVQETTPDRASFPAVADLLVHRCGSLDCHGVAARNMRLFGHEGLRLAPTDRPSSKGTTTTAEYDESYASVIYLEPELMSAVVAAAGASPERLTLVRKARGLEHHKGGALFRAGSPEDVCVTSWLAGHTETTTCAEALKAAF